LFNLFNIMQEIDKTWVLLVLKSPFNLCIAVSKEHYTLLLTWLFVILFNLIEFSFHLFLKFFQELFFYVSNSYFLEMVVSFFFGFVVEIF
jgi:hypothetical protein